MYLQNKLEINIRCVFSNNIQIKESHNPHKQGAHQEIYGLKTKKKNIRDGK